MTLEGQGILEAQGTLDNTLLGILGVIRGLAEAIRAQVESTKIVLEHIQETKDRNNNDHGEGYGNSVGEAFIANLSYQGLSKFRKAIPPSLHGDYDPALVERWVMQSEKILMVMRCMDAQKVVFVTYMSEGEAEH